MKNVNVNRQVVNVQVGVGRGCLKVRHRHRKHRHVCHPHWRERLCFDFRVAPRQGSQTLWRAVHVTPMGSVQVENRGADPFDIQVDFRHGMPTITTVQPRSTFALTARDIEEISVHADAFQGNNPLVGRVRIMLHIT